jgi:c-di-GMP-binding flagellar brake protein YcgR
MLPLIRSSLRRLSKAFENFPKRQSAELQQAFRRSGINRRRCDRVKCHNLVKCECVNDQSRNWVTNLRNISEGGLKMVCPEPLQKNDVVKLMINFTKTELNIPVAASVVWTEAKENGHAGYEVGLSFLEVLQSDKEHISNYVKASLHLPA